MAEPPRIQRSQVHGATVLTLEDSSFPLVRFVVASRRGAVLDATGRSGATRSMLDLLLRGTERADRRAFNSELEELGSAVDTSAGNEMTFVRGVTLQRHLPRTWELTCEALTSPAFPEHEFSQLVEESVDGLHLERDDDDSVAEHFLRKSLYPDHPLSRSPVGDVADLEELSVDDIRQAYRAWCASDWVIAFAGAVTPAEAEALAAPLLAHFAAAPATGRMQLPAVVTPPGLRVVVVDKPDRSQVQLRLARLAIDNRSPDLDAFWLGMTAFGGTFTSPLTREVRDVRGWSYVAQADFRRRSVFRSPLVLRSAPALDDALACLDLEVQLYRDLASGKLETSVVESTRQYLLNRFPFEVATAFDMLGSVVRDELLGLAPDDILHFPQRLESLDLQGVPQIMAKHLQPEELTAIMVAPAAAVMPDLQERYGKDSVISVDFREGLGLNQPL